MAPRPLTLPTDMKVKFFGSGRNSCGLGKYLVPSPRFGLDGYLAGGCEDLTHISETRLEESVSCPVQRPVDCPGFEQTIVSPAEGAPSSATVTSPMTPSVVLRSTKKRKAALAVGGGVTVKKRKTMGTGVSAATRRWQEVWAAKYIWAEGVFDTHDDIVGVLCTMCTTVDGRRKVMVPKDDNLQKHEGKRSCRFDGVPLAEMRVGDIYTKLDCKHFKNCKHWAGRKEAGSVAEQVSGGLVAENKRKGVQLAALFEILSHGRPMVDYERCHVLLDHLKVKNVPRKHWSETMGWNISEHMHLVVLKALKSVVQGADVIAISADEVTAVDNTAWCGVHVYVVKDWERVPHLLHLSSVSEDGSSDHLTQVILKALLNEGGLTREEVASKLVSFGADGVSTFQGTHTGVTTQFKKLAPFMLGIHCTSHRINLAIQTLSNFPMISRLEGMLSSIYSYFCRSNKKHAELQKLASLMETKGNKMLRNVTTRWISMRSPAQRVFHEYKTLVMKMGLDMTPSSGKKQSATATDNFETLVDIEVLLSLSIVQPLFSCIHLLCKFSQARDVFICDFLEAVKVAQGELAAKYIEPRTAFGDQDFKEYHELLELKHKAIPMAWKELPGDSGLKYLYFDFGTTNVFARCHDKTTGELQFVTEEELYRCQLNVEHQISEVAQALSDELDRRFPHHEVLDAFGIIYPQYWMQEGADESFQKHLQILKNFYCGSRSVNEGKPLVEDGKPYTAPEMLNASKLDTQQGLFKISMKANCEAACAPPLGVNPLIKLWRNLSASRHLSKLIPEYLMLAKIGSVLVLGSVEDERCFSSLKFLKSCQRNRLDKHLLLVVRMYGQKYFSLQSFPYNEAIQSWKEAVKVGRQGDA